MLKGCDEAGDMQQVKLTTFRCDDFLLTRWCPIPQGGAVFKLQGGPKAGS